MWEQEKEEGEAGMEERKRGRKECSKEKKVASRKWRQEEKEKATEGRDSGLRHPATVDGENSCSLRESGSREDSDEWHEEWQC